MQKSVRVEFIGGPINGALRYYSSVGVAKAVARRYVNRYWKFFGEHPYCEVCVRSSNSYSYILLCSI